MILYMIDASGAFIREHEHVKYAALPERYVTVPPPELAEGEFALWEGDGWRVVSAMPEPVDPPTPIETARSQKLAAINAKVEAARQDGFTVPVEASTALGGKVLQTRDADDRINWLVSQASYSTAVAAGQGEVMGAKFRTLDNQSVTVSYAEGLNALLAMAAWGAAAMDNSWALKDAVIAAQDQAALDAVDVEAGWP